MTLRAMAIAVFGAVMGSAALAQQPAPSLREQNASLLAEVERVHGLSERQAANLRAIFAEAGFIGQGNPAITQHPMTTAECSARVEAAGAAYANPEFERICGGKYMSPLYDPSTQTAADAKACIDQFEFPDIPCAYPVVWTRAREAALICESVGKRLCDAHEWEGACAGSLEPPDYRFDLAAGKTPNAAVALMQRTHNAAQAGKESWSYGPEYQEGVCAADSSKSPACDGGGWRVCGSNTYPAGAFPQCQSALGVFDLNGNAAEHMNLPLDPSQMASAGSRELGHTEMKGSWFIFDNYRAHPDWCRWRAPYWHGTPVLDPDSHHNYHLGFRCCKSLEAENE